jgi:FHA domain
MPTCPSGHLTMAADYCDVCDLPLAGAAAPAGYAARAGYAAPGGTAVPRGPVAPGDLGWEPEARTVPRHATPADTWQAPGPGHRAGPAPERSRPKFEWTALVTSDPTYFERVAAAGPVLAEVDFPLHCPPRRFRLIGPEVRIGRRSPSRGIEPEIDLTGPPTDFAISHLHAVLTAAPDGSWTLLDPGSANGTQLNGVEITIGEPARLHAGDRICIGAWTALTIGIS